MKCLEQVGILRDAIRKGELRPGEMVGTEAAFSQQWGLARETVRRGMETLVKEGLVERRPGKGLFVLKLPSALLNLQVVVPNLAWLHQLKMARGIQEAARQSDVQSLLNDLHGSQDALLQVLRGLPASSFDGAIVLSSHDRRLNEALFELKLAKYPFVLIDQRLSEMEIPTVTIDDYGNGYFLGQKLAELGHQRVLVLGPSQIPAIVDRINGYRDAMADARVVADRSLIVDLGGEAIGDWYRNIMGTAEDVILARLEADRPTAVFDASGDLAPFVYNAARRLDLRIPDDLSVVTFEDLPFGHYLDPDVTRFSHPWMEIGKVGLEMVLEQIRGKRQSEMNDACEHRVMTSEWLPGKSLAPPATTTRD